MRQRNLCLNLLRKTKRTFCENLDKKQVSDYKVFWKNVKPFFSDEGLNSSKITLAEKNSIVVDENKIANILNNYFICITKLLNLWSLDKSQVNINKLNNHISIKNTRNTSRNYSKNFSFSTSIQRYLKKQSTRPKCYKIINILFDSCIHFKTVRWCLFALLNSFNQLFFKGVPIRTLLLSFEPTTAPRLSIDCYLYVINLEYFICCFHLLFLHY